MPADGFDIGQVLASDGMSILLEYDWLGSDASSDDDEKRKACDDTAGAFLDNWIFGGVFLSGCDFEVCWFLRCMLQI